VNERLDDALGDLAVLAPSAADEERERRRIRLPWHLRLLDTVTAYLPLLLMALLALGTWWLVKNTPMPEPDRELAPPRHEPDYTMQKFLVQRFGIDGRMRVQIEGDEMRHYPDTDTLEIENPQIRAIGPDGRVTRASAKRALSNGDGSEVQLFGAAQVVREAVAQQPAIEFRGEFLHAFMQAERVRSHLPVVVRRGSTEVRADGMEYDNLARVIDLKGRQRAVFSGRARGNPS
jgi:lipopolysaccharide export system protein LptC